MKIIRNPQLWLILAMLLACSVLHYPEQLGVFGDTSTGLPFGLRECTVIRVFYLFPIVYSGFIFGFAAGGITSLVSLLIMLPRALFLAPNRSDAVFEVASIVIIGVLICLWFKSQAKEKTRRQMVLAELEESRQQLMSYIRLSRSSEKHWVALSAISGLLSRSLDLEEVLHSAIDMVMEVMEVEVVLISSLNEEAGELELVAHEGVSDEFVREMGKLKPWGEFSGRVAETGEVLLVDDASHDSRLTRSVAKREKLQSLVVVPLKSKDRVIGTLLVSMRRPRRFLPQEIELLTAIGNGVGLAMENAQLYQQQTMITGQLKALVKNYRGLFENASDAIWIHDLEGNIVTANRAASKLTRYDLEEIPTLNIRSFLSEESLALAREVRAKLLNGEGIEQAYDQRLIRKDGMEAKLKLTTSLVTSDGQPIGFQHIARDVTAEKRTEENLRLYVRQVTRVQEEERKRIARELHDDTAQALIALSRQIDNLTRSDATLSRNEAEFLDDLRRQINEVLDGIRRLSQDLRPSILDDLGLHPSLEWLIDELKRLYNIEASLNVIGTQRRLEPEMELILFRIVQEALTNVGRHSQASRAEVTVEFGESEIKTTVSDNGKGFELEELLDEPSRSGKLGLAGMQERVQLVGGHLSMQSEVGKGTTIIAEVPA